MMNSSCKKRLLIARRKASLWTINHYFFLHSKCGNAWAIKKISSLSKGRDRHSCYHPILCPDHSRTPYQVRRLLPWYPISITGAPGLLHHSACQAQRPSSMDSSVLVFTCPSSLCQRPSCTLLFTAFMKLKLLYTFGDGKSRKNFQGGRDLN